MTDLRPTSARPSPPADPAIRHAPAGWVGRLGHTGPGLIITAIVVGSGELIVTPKLGADEGFKLLWFVVLGCFLKVFVQIEFGRYAIVQGRSALPALNSLPGPRLVVNWILWIWLAMYLSLVFSVAGMVGSAADVLALQGAPLPLPVLAILVSGSCALLLAIGRYRLVEISCTLMVGAFVLLALGAVVALQLGPHAVGLAQLAEGFSFRMPATITTAFATFGVIGIGASELIYYPYWCLEKGYARFAGPDDGTPEWQERARGWLTVMKLDAWISFAVYTATTVVFYLLGAAILHRQGATVGNTGMIRTLSLVFRETFGEWSLGLFLLGAFAVLYSTIFGATASNARLLVDALALFRVRQWQGEEQRVRWVKLACIGLAVLTTGVFLLSGAPLTLVLTGAAAQAVMLPFLGFAAVYFHLNTPRPELRAGRLAFGLVTITTLLMIALGLYQFTSVVRQITP